MERKIEEILYSPNLNEDGLIVLTQLEFQLLRIFIELITDNLMSKNN